MPFSVLSDAPAVKDLLNFERYFDPLIDVITSERLQTPITIGVFGSWGTGKTTLLGMIERKLKEKPDRFLCVNFNPWMFRKEPNLLIPLLNALHDGLEKDLGGKFKESARKIADVLSHLGVDLLLKHLTLGTVDLGKLDELEKAYLKRRGQIDSQIRDLRQSLETEAGKLKNADPRTTIVLLIDDLDRCDPTDMIDLLESLKLFLDVENIITMLAVDKEVIDRGVEVKYGKFDFFKDRKGALGSEYLDKMIQIPVYLYPLHTGQVRGFIKAHDMSADIMNQIDLLVSALSPNPRKIKRVLNSIALTSFVLNRDKRFEDMDRGLTTALSIIRIEEPELYADASRVPALLIALENVYREKWSTEDKADFLKEFAGMAEFARERSEHYHKPVGALAALFKSCEFSKVQDKLADYLSVVGGR